MPSQAISPNSPLLLIHAVGVAARFPASGRAPGGNRPHVRPRATGHWKFGSHAFHQLLKADVAQPTARAYKSGYHRYSVFCHRAGLCPLPVLCLFVAFIAEEQLTHATIKSYLSAVRHMHVVQDPFASSHPQLQLALRGIRRQQGSPNRQPRLPITPQIVRAL